jgi:hypothetical protein
MIDNSPTGRIKQIFDVQASKSQIYDLWLSSKKHSELIKAIAVTSKKEGAKISMWDGYIEGTNVELVEDYKIVQFLKFDMDDWDDELYSKITIKFKMKPDGITQVIFNHSKIPNLYTKEIAKGWMDNYWIPMQKFFKK